jgi:hypothetical protein
MSDAYKATAHIMEIAGDGVAVLPGKRLNKEDNEEEIKLWKELFKQ